MYAYIDKQTHVYAYTSMSSTRHCGPCDRCHMGNLQAEARDALQEANRTSLQPRSEEVLGNSWIRPFFAFIVDFFVYEFQQFVAKLFSQPLYPEDPVRGQTLRNKNGEYEIDDGVVDVVTSKVGATEVGTLGASGEGSIDVNPLGITVSGEVAIDEVGTLDIAAASGEGASDVDILDINAIGGEGAIDNDILYIAANVEGALAKECVVCPLPFSNLASEKQAIGSSVFAIPMPFAVFKVSLILGAITICFGTLTNHRTIFEVAIIHIASFILIDTMAIHLTIFPVAIVH